ncbi:hypothetical protein [Vreelandella venusta]|uniref:hypothetical protein n=1 Tax=Vreelandella venusta TaxID=44935 RepID=UPI00200E495F|nr:hypothetical protein [Halomonas venusta]UQI40938.1 hypothetical protein M3L73_01380 [Halomonas venusta]
MSPERNDREFTLYNSYNVEKLTETLNARADRLCTFLLILLGSAVLADVAHATVVGLIVTSLAAVQFVYRFGETAGNARTQKLRYASLLGRIHSLDDQELAESIDRIHEHDSRPLASVEAIAFNKACLMRGQEKEMAPLSVSARLVAMAAGGYPCEPEVPKKKTPDAVD